MSTSSPYLDLHPCYSIDLNQAHQQQLYDHEILLHHHSFSSLQPHSNSSSSAPNPVQDQLGYLYMGSQLQPSPYQQEVDNKFGSYGSGSYDQTTLEINKGASRTNLKFTICKKEEQVYGGGSGGGGSEINGSSVKWMPLRLMKRMMRADEDQKHQLPPVQVAPETRRLMTNTLMGKSTNISSNNNNNDDNSSAIRVCSDCNTTKTPLWRSGPRGPKSLCNACGIRQRKARRAMAMATNGSTPASSMAGSVMRAGNGHKKAADNNNNNAFGAQKKRSKVAKASRDNHPNDAQRKPCFEEFVLKLSNKLPPPSGFPTRREGGSNPTHGLI